MKGLTYYLAEEIANLFGWAGEVDGGRYDFLPEFIEELIIQYKQDNPMTDVINDDAKREVNDLRDLFKVALGDSLHAPAVSESSADTPVERRLANGLYAIVAHGLDLTSDPDKEPRLENVLDGMARHIQGVVSNGDSNSPFTLGTAIELNRIHALAVEQDAGYSVAYQPTVKEFTVQSLGQKLEHHVSTTDSLWVAVRQAREKLEKK